MPTFIERHASKIRGVLSCFDRVVLTGTLLGLCHADAIARYLGAREIRLFDYPRFAEPFREELRTHAERLAGAHGPMIDSSGTGPSGRKTGSRSAWPIGETIPTWSTSSRRWSPWAARSPNNYYWSIRSE